MTNAPYQFSHYPRPPDPLNVGLSWPGPFSRSRRGRRDAGGAVREQRSGAGGRGQGAENLEFRIQNSELKTQNLELKAQNPSPTPHSPTLHSPN